MLRSADSMAERPLLSLRAIGMAWGRTSLGVDSSPIEESPLLT